MTPWKETHPHQSEDQLLIKELRRIIKEQEDAINTHLLKINQLELDNVQLKRCLDIIDPAESKND